MLKERYLFVRTVVYMEELLIASLNFFVIYFLMSWLHSFYFFGFKFELIASYGLNFYLSVFWLSLLIWAILLRVRGEYDNMRIQTYYRVVTNHFINGCIFLGFFASAAFLLRMEFLSRSFMIVYTATTVFLLLINRLFILSVAYYIRRQGFNYRNLLVVGTGRRAQEFLSSVAKHKEWGYRVVGLLDRVPEMKGKKIAGYSVLGTLDDLPKLLEKRTEDEVVDEVVFVVPRNWLQEIEKGILYCEAIGIPSTLSTDFFDLEIASGVPKELDGFTYLTFETNRLKEPELLVKRLLDIFVSSAALILFSPLFLVIAILIKLTYDGPVFFKQARSGRNGREFTLYKFRSMTPNAESQLEDLQTLNEMTGPVFKITNDPRVTKIGRFLRKTSLDEFPQFWNVIKGDMSIVGPRPPLPKEVGQYEPWQRRRLSMKPGITCIWQVSGRNKISFEDWMKMDLQYIDRWSLWLDFKIILLTFKAVFGASGR